MLILLTICKKNKERGEKKLMSSHTSQQLSDTTFLSVPNSS